MTIQSMIDAHPHTLDIDAGVLADCIEACFECAQTCTACADACLAEDAVADLRHCIRTDQDCADVCSATGRVLSRLTQPDWSLVRAQVEACRAACKACGEECSGHADRHEHCKVCAAACQRCEEACAALLDSIENVAAA